MDKGKTLDPKLEEALKGIWDSLTDEQKEKAKQCKTPDELAALAAKEGVELPDEALDAVAGGYVYQYNEWDGQQWWAYDDKGGRHIKANSKGDAQQIAAANGWSTKEISKAKLYWIQLKNGNC